MENGYVLLGIGALLFLSMYGYAYFAVALEDMKQKKEAKLIAEKEDIRRKQSLKHQEAINERVNEFKKRKEEIKNELFLLEKMKEKLKVS